MNLNDISRWQWTSDGSDRQAWQRDIIETWDRWKSLAPFFASHRIYLYEYIFGTRRFARPPLYPTSSDSPSEHPPWTRSLCEEDEDFDFHHIMAVRVWPARDADGHELMIRLASGPVLSEELEAIQRLNTAKARSDKRNRTIPIINTLSFDGLVFVVMPRWAPLSLHPWIRFDTIAEMLDLAEDYYEASIFAFASSIDSTLMPDHPKGLEFMHEMRVAHRDICTPNCVMNLMCPEGVLKSGQRKSGEVHYAFIDFDASIAFPMDTDLDKVSIEREMRRPVAEAGLGPGLCNPFKDDVLSLTATLQLIVRVAQTIVPEIDSFFDSILKGDYEQCPSASDVLRTFRSIRANLTEKQLNAAPEGASYSKRFGRIRPLSLLQETSIR